MSFRAKKRTTLKVLVRSYQDCDKKTGTTCCTLIPKGTQARDFVSRPQRPKKAQFSQSSKEWERLFCFVFCSCALVRFPPPDRKDASLPQPQGCSCGMRRRQFHSLLERRAQWKLVNSQLVLITEAANLHPTGIGLAFQVGCFTVLLFSL